MAMMMWCLILKLLKVTSGNSDNKKHRELADNGYDDVMSDFETIKGH